MKIITTGLFFITVILVLQSCEDIINSDKNIIIKKEVYSDVLFDQTRSVIMPLHTGNTWIYRVLEYKNGILKSQHLDSIVVLREVKINNEKWYEVWHPFISRSQNILMTNTGNGLWMRCTNCNNILLMEAQYPVTLTPYIAGSVYGTAMTGYRYNDSISFIKDSLTRYCEWKKSDIQYPGELIDYTSWYESLTKGLKTGFKTDTYLAELGLVKGNQSDDIFYDLINARTYRNGELDKDYSQEATTMDFGEVNVGEIKEKTFTIVSNITTFTIFINNIEITPNRTDFSMQIPIFPVKLQPKTEFNTIAQFSPTSAGYKEATITIYTSIGNFYIIMKGKGI